MAAYYACYVLGGYQGALLGLGVSSSAGGGPGGYYALAAG
ncbi:WzxE protein [Klebsiella pneumoniae ISC21]|nr:WzxE protein [Klebsiella pneumoniae ISC21]